MRDRDRLDKIAESVGSNFKSQKFDHEFLNRYDRSDVTLREANLKRDEEYDKFDLVEELYEICRDEGQCVTAHCASAAHEFIIEIKEDTSGKLIIKDTSEIKAFEDCGELCDLMMMEIDGDYVVIEELNIGC